MRSSKELEAVVRRFIDARVDLDVEAMKVLNSQSEFLRQIGSDRDQWTQGYDATVQSWVSEHVVQDSWNVAEASLLRIEAFEHGEVGWAAVEQERTLVNGQVFVFRITMVFVLEDYAWKLVQIHFSVPVADEQVLGVSLTSTLTDLLSSIDAETEGREALGETVGIASVMFTDVVGSTSLSQSMGDRAWSRVISDHFTAAEDIVAQYGGAVIKTVGDGGMYVFTAGAAALRAAIAMQHSAIETGDQRLELRVGIHTGDVVRTTSDYLGLTVNKAARVAAAAGGGQILVSASTVDMINDVEFGFGQPIVAQLKGIAGTHELCPLNWN